MEDRMLELRREMGVLRRQEFDAETRLDVLTSVAQAVVDVVASPPPLLVDQLCTLPDRVRGTMRARVRRGVSKAVGMADAQSGEPWPSVLPGWPEGYDAECHRLDSLEFTTATNAISDGVDFDEILRVGGAGGAGGV
jgi:hypothetical protein